MNAVRRVLQIVSCLGLYLVVTGCSERRNVRPPAGGDWWRAGTPEVAPQMLNADLPFRYPPALFAQGVEANVTLHLHVDSTGAIVPDSSRVAEPSPYPALDSAALAGAARLRFRPARRDGVPVAVSLLFPVHFRRPVERRPSADST